MPKRFIATEKWGKSWFQELSLADKCLWQYLCDCCDSAGVWEPNWKQATFQIGAEMSQDSLAAFGDRIKLLPNGKVWIVGFIQFQFGRLSRDCRPHSTVFSTLEKHGIDPTPYESGPPDRVAGSVSIGYHGTLLDKDKDKDRKGEKGKTNLVPLPEALAAIPEFEPAWRNLLDSLRTMRKPMTPHAAELRLKRLAERPGAAVAAVNLSIESRWQGFQWTWFDREGLPMNGPPSSSNGNGPHHIPTPQERHAQELAKELARQ